MRETKGRVLSEGDKRAHYRSFGTEWLRHYTERPNTTGKGNKACNVRTSFRINNEIKNISRLM